MPHCVGLPNSPCPSQAKGKDVFFRYAELDLCPHCERTRRELDSAHVSESLLKETTDGLNGTVSSQFVNPGKGPEMSNKFPSDKSSELLLQPLLAYILFSLQSGSVDKVKLAVIGYFTDQQIHDAKESLWAHCGPSVIGKKQQRRNNNSRSIKEANTLDIINALNALDKENKLPIIVVDYMSLGIIPRSHPEELSDISLCDRLNKLESRMNSMLKAVDSSVAMNLDLQQKMDAFTSYSSAVKLRPSVVPRTVTSEICSSPTVDAKSDVSFPSGQHNMGGSLSQLSKDTQSVVNYDINPKDSNLLTKKVNVRHSNYCWCE